MRGRPDGYRGNSSKGGNVKKPYDITKTLSGKYSKLKRLVKDKEGTAITEIQEQTGVTV